MPRIVISTAAEQVAAYLREEIRRAVWSGLMPGSDRLAGELGIGGNTAEAALALLEKKALLAEPRAQARADRGGTARRG